MALQGLINFGQRLFIRKRAKKFVVARAWLMCPGEDCVNDPQLCCWPNFIHWVVALFFAASALCDRLTIHTRHCEYCHQERRS